jgi:hypothetical protein
MRGSADSPFLAVVKNLSGGIANARFLVGVRTEQLTKRPLGNEQR